MLTMPHVYIWLACWASVDNLGIVPCRPLLALSGFRLWEASFGAV